MAETEVVFYQIRLPKDVHADLKAFAAEDERSLHWEILKLLREGVTARKAAHD